jgi:hypothetical protein
MFDTITKPRLANSHNWDLLSEDVGSSYGSKPNGVIFLNIGA